jgi:pimeloyl-ACP methyl ester carboxylesterase
MSVRELTLVLPHLRLAARDWNAEAGTPVLALHGWLDNAATFDRLIPRLDGVRVVALDLPGHGRSDHLPVGGGHHFVDWVPVVIAAADALGWDRFSLLGHSMGAGISSLMPSVIPERVQRLVLVEGFGPLADPAGEAPNGLAEALEQESRIDDTEPTIFQTMDVAARARQRNSDLDPDSAWLLMERGTEKVAEGYRATHDLRLKTRSRARFTEEQVLAFLGAIPCPVLAIRALQGWPFPHDVVERRKRAISNLTVMEVDGGHHVHLTNPERVAPLVADFLRGHD